MVTLYLLVGYPGSGKTTVSNIITQQTGAVHLWADHTRRRLFGTPTYSPAESKQLYDLLNQQTDELLSLGKSVVFDTNFNFRHDRDALRALAARHGAETRLLWIQVDRAVARQRATANAHLQPSRALGDIPLADFERMANSLQPPTADEQAIIIDGTKVTPAYVRQVLA